MRQRDFGTTTLYEHALVVGDLGSEQPIPEARMQAEVSARSRVMKAVKRGGVRLNAWAKKFSMSSR